MQWLALNLALNKLMGRKGEERVGKKEAETERKRQIERDCVKDK